MKRASKHDNWNGFCPEIMERVFKGAYNDTRRSDLQVRFGYYDPTNREIPQCMRESSLNEALNLAYDPSLVRFLEDHNGLGYSKYQRAKSMYRG